MSTSDPGQPGFGEQPPAQPGYGQQPAGQPGYGQPQPPPPPAPPPAYTSPPPAYNAPQAPATPGTSGTSLSFDRSKIGMYDAGIAAGFVLFFIALLLPWLRGSIGEIDFGSANGFDYGVNTFAFILFLIGALWTMLPAFGVSIQTSFPRSLLTIGAVGLGAILAIIAFFVAMGDAGDDSGEYHASLGFGAYLGLLVALAMGALAVMLFLGHQKGQAQPPLPSQLSGGSASGAPSAAQTATWTAPAAPPPAPYQAPPAPPMQAPPAPYQAPPAPEAPYQQPPTQPPYQPPTQ